jgi:hypothetical protein
MIKGVELKNRTGISRATEVTAVSDTHDDGELLTTFWPIQIEQTPKETIAILRIPVISIDFENPYDE